MVIVVCTGLHECTFYADFEGFLHGRMLIVELGKLGLSEVVVWESFDRVTESIS